MKTKLKEKPDQAGSRQRILQAAAHLFARKGFAATGVREIAQEADVNLAMINYFFGSKLGLLKEIIQGLFEPLIEFTKQNLSEDNSPQENLRTFIHQITRYFGANQDALMVFLLELSRDDPETLSFKARFMGELVDLLIRFVYEPWFAQTGRRLPMGVVGPAMGGLVFSHFQMRPMAMRLRPQDVEDLDWDTYADIITEICLNGLNGLLAKQPLEKEIS